VKELSESAIRATAAEPRVADVLFALVRALRPALVVETGSFLGHTTYMLGLAVKLNGLGRVVSCDVVEEYVREARLNCARSFAVDIRWCRGIELPELRQADLVFIDSGYADRKEEVLSAKPGAVLLVHDTARSYDANVEPLDDWVMSMGGICLPTERGLGLLIRR